jgi:hypothetical protein
VTESSGGDGGGWGSDGDSGWDTDGGDTSSSGGQHPVSQHTRTRGGRTQTVHQHTRKSTGRGGGQPRSGQDGDGWDGVDSEELDEKDQARRDRFERRVQKEREDREKGKDTGRNGLAHGEKPVRKTPSTTHAKRHAKAAFAGLKDGGGGGGGGKRKRKKKIRRTAKAAGHAGLALGFLAWHGAKKTGRGARSAAGALGRGAKSAFAGGLGKLKGEWS